MCSERPEHVDWRLSGLFVSFISNWAERLRHASTCWHSFVYTVRPERLFFFTLVLDWAHCSCNWGRGSRPVLQTVFQRTFQAFLSSSGTVFIGVYEVEATVCPRATTNNRLSGRKWFLVCPLCSCFDVPFSFFPVSVLSSRCVSPKTTQFPRQCEMLHSVSFACFRLSVFRFCLHQFSKRISGVKHLCYAVLNEWALVRMRRTVFKFINKASTQQVTWRDTEVFCVTSETKESWQTISIQYMTCIALITCRNLWRRVFRQCLMFLYWGHVDPSTRHCWGWHTIAFYIVVNYYILFYYYVGLKQHLTAGTFWVTLNWEECLT